MKISLNKIRFASEHYETSDLVPDGVDALVQKIGARLGVVEEVIPYGEKMGGVIIVKVVSSEKHQDADKLSVCKVDDGGVVKDIERDSGGHVQIVCGAPNVHTGMLAAWLPPGTTVPSTLGREPFVVEIREIRGRKSYGMLASAKELDIGDSHEGLLEVDLDVQPGTAFAKAYKTEGEAIIDIENKMFTHRPDCFGVMGITREVAGIQQKPFKSPDWYLNNNAGPEPASSAELPLNVRNELPELVPRFTMVALSGVDVKASPVWLQIVLNEVGTRPINNIVDYTNFWMLETGQPLHAYDYDKVKALSGDEATIVIRNPKPDEKIKLLNGKEIEPRGEAIMIATDKKLIGIGGVMGGSETEVDENTKNIILECANFDMYSIRRTSMAHGLFTDAVTRFTKGQSPLQNLSILAKVADDLQKYAAGQIASQTVDDNHIDKSVRDRNSLHPSVTVSVGFINDRLGLKLNADEIKNLLDNVEFTVEINGDEMSVTAPFWRTDIELREDVVEEVGRLYGFDRLPLALPKRDLTPAPKDQLLELKTAIRDMLSRSGANEILTYSFVHGDLFEKVNQDKSQAFQISNALSPDLQYYRLSLTPSLLEKVRPNIKAGYSEFALFEIGKAHIQNEPDPNEPEAPKEVNSLSFIYAAKQVNKSAAYYEARKYLENLLKDFSAWNLVRSEPLSGADLYKNPWIEQMTAPFEPNRSAVLRDREGLIWGIVGEFKPSVRRALKLPSNVAGFELDPLLLSQNNKQTNYVALPRFPKVSQDITLKVPVDLSYQDLFDFIWGELDNDRPDNTVSKLTPVDIFQREDDKDHKQVSFHLDIASYDRTLTDAEVNKLLDTVAASAKTKYGAERI